VLDDTSGCRKSEVLRRPVQLTPEDTGLGFGDPAGVIDIDPPHGRQVDHIPPSHILSPATLVPRHPDSYQQAVLPRETDGRDDIADVVALGNHGRASIDHPVPDPTSTLVLIVVVGDDLPVQCRGETGGAPQMRQLVSLS